MAARNPTAYTTWHDENLLRIGEPILAATPDAVVTDQHFILDHPDMRVSWFATPFIEDSATYVDKLVFYMSARDMCDVADVSNDEIACDFWVCVGGLDTNDAGAIKLTSSNAVASTSAEATITTGTTSQTWFKSDSSLNIKTNGNEDTITLAMKMTAGFTDDLALFGLLIVAKGT